MAIIYSYPEIPDVQGGDLLLISDTGAPNKPTRSVDIDDLAAYIGTVVGVVQNLQSVLTVGNTYVSPDGYGTFTLDVLTANNAGNIKYLNTDENWGYFLNAEEGLFFTDGTGGQTGGTGVGLGYISIGNSNHIGKIRSANITANRTYELPNASGTLALTSDIPTSSTFVDLTSAQTITGAKTFDGAITSNDDATFNSLYIGTDDNTIALDGDDMVYVSGDSGINLESGDGINLRISDTVEIAGTTAMSVGNGNLDFGNLTQTRNYAFPNASGTIALTSDIPTPGPSGSGTTNYTARWTSASALGIGALYDNGTNVGIGTTSPSTKLHVVGNARVTGAYYDSNNSPGTANQVLVSTASGTDWVDGSGSGIIGGPYLPLTGGTMTGSTVHNDNVKSIYGTASDGLEIYHDGTDSYINDTGTGGLIIRAANNIKLQTNQAELYFQGIKDGAVKLYYNNAEKLLTTSTGVSVTGAATATTFLGDLNGTINTATTAVTKANATNDTTVATTAFVQNLIGTIPAGLVFQGTWNAATNTPTLTSGTGTTGHFYIVSTSGSTNLDGVTDWVTGDWAVFVEVGATDAWQKIDNSSVLDGAGTGQTLPLWSGSGTSNTLDDSILTQSGGSIITQTATGVAQYSLDSIAANDIVVNFKQAGVQRAKIGYDNSEGALAFVRGTGSFATAGMVLDATGVGIGTTSPGFALDVHGDSTAGVLSVKNAANGRDTFRSENAAGTRTVNIGNDGSGHGSILIRNSSGTTTNYISGSSNSYFNAGNVGIGDTSPSFKLDVNVTSSRARFKAATGDANIELSSIAGHDWLIQSKSDSSFAIYDEDAATERIRIDSSGNVGIGTTSPTFKLHVNSTDASDNVAYIHHNNAAQTSGDVLKVRSDAGDNAGSALLNVANNTGSALYVRGDRNVGIGTTSPQYITEISKPQAGGVGPTLYLHNSINDVSQGHAAEIRFNLRSDEAVTRNAVIKAIAESSYGSSPALTFFTSSGSTGAEQERMRITSTGNIGIGATSPLATLVIQPSLTSFNLAGLADGQIAVGNNAGGATAPTIGAKATSTSRMPLQFITGQPDSSTVSGMTFSVREDNNSDFSTTANKPAFDFSRYTTSLMRIDRDGKVGIGTTSPSAKLEVAGAVGSFQTTGHQIFLTRNGNNEIYAVGASSVLALGTNGAEKMRITSAGILMVGGTTGGYAGTKIHVGNFTDTQNGINILSSTTGYGYLLFGDGTGADTYRGQIAYYHGDDSMLFNTNGSEKLRIVSGGGISFAGATNFGSAGQVLKSNGSASPAWVDASTVIGGPYLPLAGGTMTGTAGVLMPDNFKLNLGTSSDLQIYHDGSNSYIKDNGIGDLRFMASNIKFYDNGTAELMAQMIPNGAVELYYNNSKKFETSNTGASVTGSLVVSNDITATGDLDVRDIDARDGIFTGNVGVGTTSPETKLTIENASAGPASSTYATTASNANLHLSAVGVPFYNHLFMGVGSATYAWIQSQHGNSNAQNLALNPIGGNVGIGTTSPTHLLTLETASSPGIKIKDTTQGATLLAFSQDSNSHLGTYSPHPLVFDTNSTERMRIASSGNVGIGVTSSINGTLTLPNSGVIAFHDANADARNSLQFVSGELKHGAAGAGLTTQTFFTNGSERIRITSTGNVGIGTTAPTTKLHVNGDIRIQGENELYFGGTGSVPHWEITASGSDLIVNDTGTNVGSVLFNNDEGVALPRLTTTEINAISSPTQGLMAYNTTLNTICFYNGSSWQKVNHANM